MQCCAVLLARSPVYTGSNTVSIHSFIRSLDTCLFSESGIHSPVFSSSNAVSKQLQQFCVGSHRHAVLQTVNSQSTSRNITSSQCYGRFVTSRQAQSFVICWDMDDSWGQSHGWHMVLHERCHWSHTERKYKIYNIQLTTHNIRQMTYAI